MRNRGNRAGRSNIAIQMHTAGHALPCAGPANKGAMVALILRQMSMSFCAAALWALTAAGLPAPAQAQAANFHPCNSQPSLPMCQHGYGKRIAVQRWGAQPEPLDPDAAVNASLVTRDPAKEIGKLKSSTILVQDMDTAEILFARNEDAVRPIASITKLMAALTLVKAGLPMDEMITIDASDTRSTSELPSRLTAGAKLSRADLLRLALVPSENSAAQALGRTYTGGTAAFVAAMNAEARALGMTDSSFAEPSGLSNDNQSSAKDLVKLLQAISAQPLIRQYASEASYQAAGQTFRNTNILLGRPQWDILVSKTGTTREAGDCLVMAVKVGQRNLAMVLLNAQGTNGSRFGDAVRLRRVLDSRFASR